LEGALPILQRRWEVDLLIWKVFGNMLMRDFLGFLGERASKNVRNIGGTLTSQDLSIDINLLEIS